MQSLPSFCQSLLTITLQNTMVVGYDAYHEGGRRGGASWGAVVASYNQSLTRYFGQVTRHASHQELANNFSAAITSKEEREWEEEKYRKRKQ